jgi:hypothetical protein
MQRVRPSSLLDLNVTVPEHVVYRSFPSETVVLNLQTGRYHGLNTTAAHMLEELQRAGSVRAAAVTLAARYEMPSAEIEQDLCDLCATLLDRGLIEADDGSPA